MESEWILWVAVLVAWPLAGLAIAYLFGEFARGAENPEDATIAPTVSYLRRQKRAPRALGSIETGIRRVAGARSTSTK